MVDLISIKPEINVTVGSRWAKLRDNSVWLKTTYVINIEQSIVKETMKM